MKLDVYMAALELAREDEAFAQAAESSDSITLSMGDDGGVTLEAGDESVAVSPEELMGEDEAEEAAPAPEAMAG